MLRVALFSLGLNLEMGMGTLTLCMTSFFLSLVAASLHMIFIFVASSIGFEDYKYSVAVGYSGVLFGYSLLCGLGSLMLIL